MPDTGLRPTIIDLGRMGYAEAYALQAGHVEEVVARRLSGDPDPGRILLVEHPPVITITRRPEARSHLLATPELLVAQGVEAVETDRGGDITYHGPGQVVVYPILDLEVHCLRVGDYLRLLEQATMDTCAEFGVLTVRDPDATGVWTRGDTGEPVAKIAAIGIRIRRWVTMHGLALNVTTNLSHFGLIVPCGLAGRRVTSLASELGERSPSADQVKARLAEILAGQLHARRSANSRLP